MRFCYAFHCISFKKIERTDYFLAEKGIILWNIIYVGSSFGQCSSKAHSYRGKFLRRIGKLLRIQRTLKSRKIETKKEVGTCAE